MPKVAVERTIGEAKKAVLGGLIGYNTEKMGKQKYKRFAITLRERGKIVGGIVGEVWTTVLFIQLFWIERKYRGKDFGTKLIEAIKPDVLVKGADYRKDQVVGGAFVEAHGGRVVLIDLVEGKSTTGTIAKMRGG